MSSPERLNVLISRARNGLILVGNSSTFERSRKGGQLWSQFFDLLRSGGYIYKGLPISARGIPVVYVRSGDLKILMNTLQMEVVQNPGKHMFCRR